MPLFPLRLRRWSWRDTVALAALATFVVAGWSLGTGHLSWSDLAVPGAYLETEQSEVLVVLAQARAAADGLHVPMKSKWMSHLGAPTLANWSDWPRGGELQVMVLGWLTRACGPFAALNLFALAGHLLAAASFFLVARLQGVGRAWSLVGGAAFGLAPFLFAHAPHEPEVQQCWHVPWFVPVWRWLSRPGGLGLWSSRFWFSVAVAVLAGTQHAAFGLAFVLLAVVALLFSPSGLRDLAALRSASLVLAAAGLSFAAMHLDTWVFWANSGMNVSLLDGEQRWLEHHGLKLADLFLPPATHAWHALAAAVRSRAEPRALGGEGNYLGVLGLACLLTLAALSIRAVLRRRWSHLPAGAGQVLVILAFFSTGGLNLIAGFLGLPFQRTGHRVSVVVLLVVLLLGVRLASRSLARWPRLSWCAALLALGLVLADQVPQPPTPQVRSARAAQVESDRAFTLAMEAALPAGAMVMQLPHYSFPESAYPGLGPYAHLRPYLHSRELRYSFGGVRGRLPDLWFQELGQLSFADAVPRIRRRGFQAIFLNRAGYPDRGQIILELLAGQGFRRVIESRAGDLICVPLF